MLEEETYYFDCPCADRFYITVDDLLDGEELADCPQVLPRARALRAAARHHRRAAARRQ